MSPDESGGTRIQTPLKGYVARPTTTIRCHCLVVKKGTARGRLIQIGLDPLTVGREDPCSLLLADAEVSRRHCQFTVVNGKAHITDLGSSNGTILNGQLIDAHVPMRLFDGALIELGAYVLAYTHRNPREVELTIEIEDDLEKASKYVRALLPSRIQVGDILADWFFQPSAAVGGDAFGYQHIDDNHFALYLMDVSGHGAAAALHTVSVMNLLRHRALPDTDFRQPSQVIASLNNMFQMEDHGGMFFTMWYGVFNKASRSLTYSSAGQHPAFVVPKDKSHSIALGTKGLMVGALPDYQFQSAAVTMPADSHIYLFSDGVFEISTRQGLQWRLADFLPSLLEPAVNGVGEGQRLNDAVRAVANPGPLEDDFSMLVVTFL
jgi:serine phosphatase RsbU (regulator of sigma subunit)